MDNRHVVRVTLRYNLLFRQQTCSLASSIPRVFTKASQTARVFLGVRSKTSSVLLLLLRMWWWTAKLEQDLPRRSAPCCQTS